jgi:hypothetical protein
MPRRAASAVGHLDFAALDLLRALPRQECQALIEYAPTIPARAGFTLRNVFGTLAV